MKFLRVIFLMLIVFQVAVFTENLSAAEDGGESTTMTFDSSNCKTVSRDPGLTLCISSMSEGKKFSKRSVRRISKSIKSAVKDLVQTYKKENYGDEATESKSSTRGIVPCDSNCSGGDRPACCCINDPYLEWCD